MSSSTALSALGSVSLWVS